MKVFEIPGRYAPARLAGELRVAGVDCQGVTATEDASSVVTAVQVICGDRVTLASVQAVTAVHDPNDPPPLPPPKSEAAVNLTNAVNAVVSAPDFATAKVNLAAMLAAQGGKAIP